MGMEAKVPVTREVTVSHPPGRDGAVPATVHQKSIEQLTIEMHATLQEILAVLHKLEVSVGIIAGAVGAHCHTNIHVA